MANIYTKLKQPFVLVSIFHHLTDRNLLYSQKFSMENLLKILQYLKINIFCGGVYPSPAKLADITDRMYVIMLL